MGYQSPYMRFGNTRYEKDIAKLRRYDYNIRYENYKNAKETLDGVLAETGLPQSYIENVWRYAEDCEHKLVHTKDDDATLVKRYAKHSLGDEEYYWLKSQLAKKGEEWEELPW